MALRTFVRGSATFPCRVCERLTRATTQYGAGDICAECFELAGIENTISDCGIEDAMVYRPEAIGHLKALRAKKVDIAKHWGDLMTDFNISADLA